jgi:diguanylate cyclase (GGDEF)-like protein
MGNITHYTGIFGDISNQAQARERLHRLAYYDPLTGMPNRELLNDRFKTLLSLARRHKTLLGVLFLDLDQFKQINDSLGHAAGDELLKEATLRFSQCIRQADILSRVGGDEFVVLLTDLQQRDEIAIVADKLAKTLNVPFILDQSECFVTVSIGVSIFPDDGMDISTLIKNADSAMYNAKKAGRNRYTFFSLA